jgi:hypothetical protein
MTDKEALIRMCERLAYKRIVRPIGSGIKPGDAEWAITEYPGGHAEIRIGCGADGYIDYFATFYFDPDGNVTGHEIAK